MNGQSIERTRSFDETGDSDVTIHYGCESKDFKLPVV